MSLATDHEKYVRNQILTASPAELTLMLYNGAIKFGMRAVTAIEQRDIEKAHHNIMKVEAIIEEFLITLDYSIPVSESFKSVYDYLCNQLHEANVKKSIPILEEVLDHLRTMRDTWKEVMRLTNATV